MKKYDHQTKEIFQLIKANFHIFSALDNEQKLFWLLNFEDKEILNLMGKFINDNML